MGQRSEVNVSCQKFISVISFIHASISDRLLNDSYRGNFQLDHSKIVGLYLNRKLLPKFVLCSQLRVCLFHISCDHNSLSSCYEVWINASYSF